MKSIGLAYGERTVDGKTGTGARYCISSLSCDRKRFGDAVREHWGIENSLHRVLDIVFDEDQKRTRKGHGAENVAAIRRIALNLLRDCPMKGGIKNRRILANADCAVREKVLKI